MKNQWNCLWQLPKVMLCLCISICFLLMSNSLYAQENCNDGIDNDGDGLIDCYDPDCCGNIDCDGFYYKPPTCTPSCQVTPPPFVFQMQQGWQSVNGFNGDDVPIIGDLDGNPNNGSEIVITSFNNRQVSILDGIGGNVQFATLSGGNGFNNLGSFSAIGNVDLDTLIEVIITSRGSDSIDCFEFIGGALVLQWSASITRNNLTTVPGIADFNGDGIAEVYVGVEVFDGASGFPLITGAPSQGEGRMGLGSGLLGNPITTIAADVIPGGNLELVAGNTVYNVTINGALSTLTVASQVAPINGIPLPDGRTAIADYDNDGDLDGFITAIDGSGANAFLYVWDLQTGTLLDSYAPLRGPKMSLAALGDVDGDGVIDVVLSEDDSLKVLSGAANLAIMGQVALNEPSWASPSLFDFDGDGVKEIIFRDGAGSGSGGTSFLYVFSALNQNLMQWGNIELCNAPTAMEVTAVIADIDNDNEAEIVTMCGTLNARVTVFESAPGSSPWRPCRNMWNQYAYFGTNVNDNLSIPNAEQQRNAWFNGSNSLNYFLGQYSDTFNAAPDATISILSNTCAGNDMLVTISICNTGDELLPANTPLSIYTGNPVNTAIAPIITTTPLGQVLQPGICTTIVITIPNFISGTKYYASINDDGSVAPLIFPVTTILECGYNNNITSFKLEKPSVSISANPIGLHCAGELVVLQSLILGGIAPYTYNWSTGHVTSSISLFPTTTTTYTIDVSDANSCVGSANVLVKVQECCFAEDNPDFLQITIANSSNLASQGLGTFSGNTFTVTPNQYHVWPDKVYVDEDVTVLLTATGGSTTLDLTNTDIVFGQCARIDVAHKNASIIAYNAVFRPCDPLKSWYGIRFLDGNLKNHLFQECTFVNANRGIDILVSDLRLSINNNLFTNCQRAIQFPTTNLTNELANISGNTFELDDKVQDIVYTNRLTPSCVPLAGPNISNITFFGIHGGWNFTRPITQNDFVNNTDVNNHARFHGIFSTGVNMNISNNNFTNMHRSIDVSYNVPNGTSSIVIENNKIEVTNNVVGEHYQIRITDQTCALVENNTIVSSSEESSVSLNEAAIYVHSDNTVVIRNNAIQGFQIGLFNDVSRCYVVNNKIYSHFFGIYHYNFANTRWSSFLIRKIESSLQFCNL